MRYAATVPKVYLMYSVLSTTVVTGFVVLKIILSNTMHPVIRDFRLCVVFGRACVKEPRCPEIT